MDLKFNSLSQRIVVIAAVVAVLTLIADTSLAAGQCRTLKGTRSVAGGRFVCTTKGFYRCEKGSNGWRWVYFAPMCPHLDPRPGQAAPAPAHS